MPRVTDFPDQKQSMMQAVMQNRQLNQQADQTFLTAQMKNEQMNQSMLGMVIGDTLSRDQMDQQQNQFDDQLGENARQFNTTHGENVRSNKVNEDLLDKQIAIARDRLTFDEETQQTGEELTFLDSVQENLSNLSQAYATVDSLEQKRQAGGQLFGEDAENYDAARQIIDSMSRTGIKDMVQRGRSVGIDDEIIENLGAGFTQYLSQGIPETTSPSVPSEGSLNRTTYSTQTEEDRFGLISRTIGTGAINNLFRFASAAMSGFTGTEIVDESGNKYKIPGIDARIHHDLQEVVLGEREYTDTMRRKFNEQFDNWSEVGTHGLPTGEDRARRDQSKTGEFYQGMIAENIAAEATQRAKNAASSEDLATKPLSQITEEWLQNPLNQAIAEREGTPQKVRQGRVAAEKLQAINQSITQLGTEAYSKMSKGEKEAHVLATLDAVGFHGSSVNDLAKIHQDFQEGNVFFFDEAQSNQLEALINNLNADIGFAAEE